MEKLNTAAGMEELGIDESMSVTGGDDVLTYLKCVSGAMSSGGGGFRTFVLGATIFGMARMVGVMVGCSASL